MSDPSVTVAAVDLGASSGRVLVGHVAAGQLDISEVSRFANAPVRVAGTLQWDISALYDGVLAGLRAAGQRGGPLDSIGIDSWGVDYGLLDEAGTLLENPVHYRDERTTGVMAKVLDIVPADELYRMSGIQFLPFNTIFQLVAALPSPAMSAARTLLLIPDLLAYWLTGHVGAERTNASTTQLLDVTTGAWAVDIMARLGIDHRLFPQLTAPGEPLGAVRPEMARQAGFAAPVPVTAVGSHDTASAVVGVPATVRDFGYISCGTWSLVGLELDAPVLTEASRAANFTNEQGVDGTTRYLRNVMGLWLLQESLRTWSDRGLPTDLDALLVDAARTPAFAAVVDPDHSDFLAPGDMPARIAAACERTGQDAPTSQAGVVRCILDSLALAYRAAIRAAQELSGRHVEVVHLVGGGSQNALLCQLTADACAVPVVAGPVEAAALGNVLVQARSLGAVSGGLADLRRLVVATVPLVRYEPHGNQDAWTAAAARLR
ncbi:MAG TPA: rhamnulokinase family protein [Acidothermaceae bacterium]